MKRLALTLFLGLSAFAAQAGTPAPAEPAASATPAAAATPVGTTGEARTTAPATVNGEAVAVTEAAAPKLDPGCVRESGTRIKKRDKKGCTGAPGSSYSRADIDRTGAVDTADAVRKLSPSATVSRGN